MRLREWVQDGKWIVFRPYTLQDTEQLIDIQRECFPPPFPEELWWNPEQISEHVTRFPQGAVCAELNGELIGSITTLIIDYQKGDRHAWSEVTDEGYIRNHNPKGNTLYVVDISVRPRFRSLGIGRRLLQCMYYVVIEQKLERLLGGGRMPGYHQWREQYTPEQYLDQVITGKLKDPVISFMLKSGRIPYGVAHDYLEDEESANCAALMAWENPFMREDDQNA